MSGDPPASREQRSFHHAFGKQNPGHGEVFSSSPAGIRIQKGIIDLPRIGNRAGTRRCPGAEQVFFQLLFLSGACTPRHTGMDRHRCTHPGSLTG